MGGRAEDEARPGGLIRNRHARRALDSAMTPAPLRRVWLVANAASGSTTSAVIDALRAGFAERGIDIAGESDFPAQSLPDSARLDAAGADTLVICAGDGTINAAWCAADDWGGQCLVLPGGTMNGLAKALHGDVDWSAILDALDDATLTRPPLAEAQGHRALVGVILGPAAAWVDAREGVRKGRLAAAARAARAAWSRTFGSSVRVTGGTGKHRAVIVSPAADGLQIATISADGVRDVVRLGWRWLLGDWRADPGVVCTTGTEVTLRGRRTIRALFDGEPAKLASPACVRSGKTRLAFIATRREDPQ